MSATVCRAERLDARSVSKVRADIGSACSGDTDIVVLDVSEVDLVDRAGLALLAATHRELRRRGRRLVLRGCGPRIRRVLTLSRLSRVVAIERASG